MNRRNFVKLAIGTAVCIIIPSAVLSKTLTEESLFQTYDREGGWTGEWEVGDTIVLELDENGEPAYWVKKKKPKRECEKGFTVHGITVNGKKVKVTTDDEVCK